MRPEPIPVLVSAIGGGGHGEQILKALRLAPEGSYFIVGADANPYCPQFANVDQAVILPRTDAPDFLDAVLAVCARMKIRAVFHGREPDLKKFSEHRRTFAERGILLPINPAHVIDTCFDKIATSEFLARNGFAHPRFRAVRGAADLDGIDWFPVVVKPAVGSGGSANCFLAQTPRQLALLAEYLALEGAGFIVQEYVGTPDNEYTVGVLHDLDGQFLNSIAVRRELKSQLNVRTSAANITSRKDLGPTLVISSGISHGYVDRFPEVTGPCEKIAAALGARGAINFQCRLVDGKVMIFEINPRFSGTTSIRAMMGYNEPDLLLRKHLRGEAIAPRFPYRSGMVLRSLGETLVPTEPAVSWRTLADVAAA
jgi:carbamoyl-phosphate synthase large subunit